MTTLKDRALAVFSSELRDLASGWVEVKVINGHEYLYYRCWVGRRKISRYLGKKSSLDAI